MPRRNWYLLFGLSVFCLICAANVSSPRGRMLSFAMEQIQLRSLEETDSTELFEGALEGMMDRLDDYSFYISPEMLEEFNENLDMKFAGVGIEILLDPDTKYLTVISPLADSPAYEAGIRASDQILRIDGKSTHGLSLDDAKERMRGVPGEPVILTVKHSGDDEPVDLKIVRQEIRVDSVLGDTRNPDGSWNTFLEGHDRIGYLRITSFSEKTVEELDRALRWLETNEMKGLILDLRNNPGGLLSAAIGVCDLFVDPEGVYQGQIVSTRRRDGQADRTYEANEGVKYDGFPMVVLVNQYSASASEIVAACLQDHSRAVVVGQRSYGKGTVQELIDLHQGQGILKLTTSSYWRPSGKNIHRGDNVEEDDDVWGVSPDEGYTIELDDEQIATLLRQRLRRKSDEEAPDIDDPQLDKAVECVEEAVDSKSSHVR